MLRKRSDNTFTNETTGGMEMVRDLLDIVTIIIALAPIGIKIFQLIAQKTHNQRLINLSQRAQIIVEGLEQSNLTNEEKKTKAYKKVVSLC